MGNKIADRKAGMMVYRGRVSQLPDQVTPAGIRQEYRIHSRPKHLGWDHKSMKGLTYIVTGRGPTRWWLKVIGRRDDDRCDCGSIQNAAHLLSCPLIADGMGRTVEECWEDQQWCRAVAEFLD